MRLVVLCAVLAGSLAACHASDDATTLSHKDKQAEAAIDNAVAANGTAAALNGLPVPQAGAIRAERGIPAAFVARWGRTKADCRPAVSAPPGLLEITPDTVRAEGQSGQLIGITRRSQDDVTATLDMSGGGRHSTSTTHLVLSAGGTRLDRSDAASPTHYHYQRC